MSEHSIHICTRFCYLYYHPRHLWLDHCCWPMVLRFTGGYVCKWDDQKNDLSCIAYSAVIKQESMTSWNYLIAWKIKFVMADICKYRQNLWNILETLPNIDEQYCNCPFWLFIKFNIWETFDLNFWYWKYLHNKHVFKFFLLLIFIPTLRI